MSATNYTGVYESRGKSGRTVIKIKYSIQDRQKKETLGVKGALISRGGQDEKLTPAIASLIRADRITQFARRGEEVLSRNVKAITVGEGCKLLYESMVSDGMPGAQTWRGTYGVYIEDRWGDTLMDEIKPEHVQKALKDWRTKREFYTRYGGPPKPATINQALKLLLRIYRFCSGTKKYYGEIPVGGGRDRIGVVQPKTVRKLQNESKHYFKPDEADRVLEAVRLENHELWLQCVISLLTGARQVEICGETFTNVPGKEPHHGLRWKDINWDANQITILRKDGDYQTIPVNQTVLDILRKEPRTGANQRVTGVRFQREAWDLVLSLDWS